jgi:two-component system sensor kinase FixL
MQNAIRSVDAILEEAQRGAEVVRRLRTCLIENDTTAESFELGGLLGAVIGTASAAAADSGIAIVCERPHLHTTVRGDPVLIRQVLLNLIRNAADAIRDACRGAGTIRIGTHVRADGFAEIAVVDDGVGVAGSMRERIFEPAVTTKREGTGIGLTISRSIVEAHGGRLWAEPNRRYGTTFKFTLPAAAAA